jgi:hypothetical protein
MQAFKIGAHDVTATFDVQDFRGDPADGLGGINVFAQLTVDDQPGFEVLFQNDGDGVQYIPRASEAEAKQGGNEELFDALGGERDEDGDIDDEEFADLLLMVTVAAQAAFDAKIVGAVVNADDVPEDEAVPLQMSMGCWVGGWGFVCNGDGYISIGRAEGDEREWRKYRIGADLAEQLEEIADETSHDDAARTSRVLALFDADEASA